MQVKPLARTTRRVAICTAALSLAIGAVALYGCADSGSEQPTSLNYHGTQVASVTPTAETVAGVWKIDPDSQYAEDKLGWCLVLEQDGSATIFDTQTGEVNSGTWDCPASKLHFNLDMFYASGQTDFSGYLFDNGVLTSDGSNQQWLKLEGADADEVYAELSRLQGEIAQTEQGAQNRAAAQRVHPEVDFDAIDRANAKLEGYADAYALADSSPMPAINAPAYWYYDLCSEDERAVYDAIVALCRLPDAEKVAAIAQVSFDPTSSEGSDAANSMLSKVRKYVEADHPELAFVGTFSISCAPTGVTDDAYQITLYRDEAALASRDCGAASTMLEEMFASANSLLAGIDLSAPAPVVELAIYDALVDLVTYDDGVYAGQDTAQAGFEASADSERQDSWLDHNTYGALVRGAEGTPNLAVCEGYAESFQLLLQMAGIEAVTVSGIAGPYDSAFGHEWVLVNLDGDWYSVDPTWGEGPNHTYFNLTTAQMAENAAEGTIHMRSGHYEAADYTIEVGDSADDLAPVAEGTIYTYDAILAMM